MPRTCRMPAGFPSGRSDERVDETQAQARERKLKTIDATCPLVTKVHLEAIKFAKEGYHIILIGHAGHPEVVGTLGQLPPGAITLVETEAYAESFERPGDAPLAYATQTTL